MNFELKRKKFGRGIPNDMLIDIRGVAVLAVIKELPLVDSNRRIYLHKHGMIYLEKDRFFRKNGLLRKNGTS